MNNIMHSSQEIYKQIIQKLRGGVFEEHSKNNNTYTHLLGKKILITGGAGSIGSDLAKTISRLNPSAVGLVDINETGLADLWLDLNTFPACETKVYLTDISDEFSVRKVFCDFRPDYVFHTAAYKHVPMMELFPEVALKVNIIGTFNVANLAGQFSTEKFILISTDKAVNSVCILGNSKKIAEHIVKRLSLNYKTNFIIVRFGNVIGTRGSVAEIIKKQILNGGPVTLTHPEMKRFFLTTSEALNLILLSSNFGEDGNLFIPDMDRPIYIIDLINEFIRQFSSTGNSKIKIIITGIRPGEKLDENLMTDDESKCAIFENGYYRIDSRFTEDDQFELIEYFKQFNNKTYSSICKQLFTLKPANYI